MKTKFIVTEIYKVPVEEQPVRIAESLAVLIKSALLDEADKQIA